MVAEADDSLMEKFFDAGTLTQDELLSGLKRGISAGRVFPVLCASATANIGMQPLLEALIAYVPSPAERPLKGKAVKSGDDIRGRGVKPTGRRLRSSGRPLPTRSPGASRCSASSPARPEGGLDRPQRDERHAGTARASRAAAGKDPDHVPEIKAGDIGAVAKLKESQTNDLLADKAVAVSRSPGTKFPEPVISYAIEPKSRGDEEKISTALHRLQEEDPTINYTRDAQTKELLLAGQGQSHIEVTVAKLKRRFGVEVNLKLPRIPYRETITARYRSARPAQEADRRPRSVRRLQGEVRTAAARQRVRVRRRHLRRIDPAPVRAGD